MFVISVRPSDTPSRWARSRARDRTRSSISVLSSHDHGRINASRHQGAGWSCERTDAFGPSRSG
ncbi:hypothetical protein HMPREF1549_00962 [Actinomyces johnsonii F0510]|uniref:Uncharacterized protein n=1 Tax=Actinomyces johnsonii F0510 TaxID=1227262 RepID=U1QG75_9ACTO|nr:hypothetical protein HMPREF1549_00962 [Actinomyces johnsonii F0510]